MLEELREGLLVALGSIGVGRSRVCPGLVGGSQGTALTALDYRRKFRRIPNLLSDGDCIRGNVGDLGTKVFTKDDRERKVESLEITSDNGLPIPELHRASQ